MNEGLFSHSLDHILPDNLFASPKKSASDHFTVFSTSSAEAVEADDKTRTPPTTSCSNSNPSPANASGLNMSSLKTYLLQMPRYISSLLSIATASNRTFISLMWWSLLLWEKVFFWRRNHWHVVSQQWRKIDFAGVSKLSSILELWFKSDPFHKSFNCFCLFCVFVESVAIKQAYTRKIKPEKSCIGKTIPTTKKKYL